MKTKILLSSVILLVVIGCRQKSSDNYEYYQPYEKRPLLVSDTDSLSEVDTINDVVDEPVVVEVKGVDLNDNYFIVIASYAIEEYAEAQKAELITQGYKPEIFMVNEDGWYKLAIKSYATKEEASNELEKMKLNNVYPNSRIVFKKGK